MASLALHVSSRPATLAADDPDMPRLHLLRSELRLRGPRFGCGLGR